MKVGYIKKLDEPISLIDKIRNFCYKIEIWQFNEGYIFKIPMYYEEKNRNKIANILLKRLEKIKVDRLVFSEKIIKENPAFYGNLLEKLQSNRLSDYYW